MNSLSYIPLRATSQYSLLEGAMQIESIVEKAINHNIPAVGLTDRNNLFGALEFSEKLIDKGIQPIVGCNLSFYDQKNYGSMVCLAKNEQGYKNLIKLSSELFLTNDDGFQAKGLKNLIKNTKSCTNSFLIAAPERNQSGKSHSITINQFMMLSLIMSI